MHLVEPTDFEVLDAFADGKRNIGANIAAEIDADRGYVNSRLRSLEDYNLLERVGPINNSGLYVITSKGQFVLEHRDIYQNNDTDFDSFVNKKFNQEVI